MLSLMIALAGQAALAPSMPVSSRAEGPVNPITPLNPNANSLFDRDVALKQWAVRIYDANRDGWLTLYEAQGALAGFKDLADGDRDGRVTTYEYDRAKEFIAAR